MHLAIGSFISNDDPGMAVRMAKKNNVQVQYSKTTTFQVHHNFFLLASPKENKQTERTLTGTPQQLWPITVYISLPLLHKYNVKCPCQFHSVLLTQSLSFTGWFGIRKDFCDFLLGTCPFLQEYGNISCKFSESIFLRPPPEETAVEPQRKPVMHEYPAKCVVPVVSIEMPDQWKKIASLYIVKEHVLDT